MQIPTKDLEGNALDYAVAVAMGYETIMGSAARPPGYILLVDRMSVFNRARDYALCDFRPGADTAEGRAINERIFDSVNCDHEVEFGGEPGDVTCVAVGKRHDSVVATIVGRGPTKPVAILRTFVELKLGEHRSRYPTRST